MRYSRLRYPLLVLFCVAVGCGGDSRVPVHEMRGIVLFQEKPMAGGGSIALLPISSQRGKGAGGTIDADGRFVLSTYGDGDGAMAGTFRVVITQSVWDEPENWGDGDGSGQPQNQPVRRVAEDEVIPAIYSHFEDSPLIIDILSDGNPNITIYLTSPPSR